MAEDYETTKIQPLMDYQLGTQIKTPSFLFLFFLFLFGADNYWED